MSDQNNIFPQKYSKQLPTGFEEVAQSMKNEDLQDLIYKCEANIYTIEQAKENDANLQKAKEQVKEYSEPYADAKKVQTAKIKYVLFVLQERGVDLDKAGL